MLLVLLQIITKKNIMKIAVIRKACIWVLMLSSFKGISQSNPTPFNLEVNGTYTFTNWAATSSAGTYPNNMIFHTLANVNSTLATATASSNVAGVYNNTGATTRMNGLDVGGFSFRNSSTTPDIAGYVSRRLGESVLGLNTTNRTNIQVSWKAGEIGSAIPVYGITCQYRIGTSGSYTTLPGALSASQYLSTNVSSSVSYGPITLPSSCDNQSVVQIRWVYHYVSGGVGIPSPQLFVDDITVNSIPLVALSPLPNTCSFAPSFLLTDGQPAGGVYSGVGVVGNNFDPAIAGSGIHTITYTYTDGNGFSNFATTNIDVDPSYCITTTTLTPASCGATGLSLSSYVNCEVVYGAEDYEFQFSNTSLGYSQSAFSNSNAPKIKLINVTGLQYGQTYDVKVKAKFAGVWGAFSSICQITLMPFPTTSLSAGSCGATGLTPTSYIWCNPIAGATDYEYTISNSSIGYSQVKYRGTLHSSIHLTMFTGLLYGETYDVVVKAKVGGVWGPAGSTCQITLSSLPTTSLHASSCGATGLNKSSYIKCIAIPGATDYEYTITNTSLGYSQVRTRGSLHTTICLNVFSGLLPNTTYDVTVKAYVSGLWSSTGASCTISTSSFAAIIDDHLSDLRNLEVLTSDLGKQNFNVYPNPVSKNSFLNIELAEQSSITLIISDIMGRLIFEKTYSDVKLFQVALSELQLEQGAYTLSIVNGTEIQNKKLFITN